MEQHLNKCKEICKPNEVIHFLSKKECVCNKSIEEEVTPIE